ncbi:transposable element Tcb1 transposase [Trichonephila clavipes]|nr:transposable element Tcb1 transposase [Trichonephila clavipes]
MNHSTTDSAHYASFGVLSYHSTPLVAEWNVCKGPLLCLPLIGNHTFFRRQWGDERRTWTTEWNDIELTNESRFYLQHHNGRTRVWRHRGAELLRYASSY